MEGFNFEWFLSLLLGVLSGYLWARCKIRKYKAMCNRHKIAEKKVEKDFVKWHGLVVENREKEKGYLNSPRWKL